METKVCLSCEEEKCVSLFYKKKLCQQGVDSFCAVCRGEVNRVWRESHKGWLKDYHKWKHIKKKYGISKEEYEGLFSKQGGVCRICHRTAEESGVSQDGKNHYLVVDHDHDTGVVRGILCHQCNAGIGLLRDDPVLLTKAIVYLTT